MRHHKAPNEKYHRDLLDGAREWAANFGYTIDVLPFGGPDGPKLGTILHSRGIRAVLIEPFLPDNSGLPPDLNDFAVVVVDNPHFSRNFDQVTYDNFGEGADIVEQCLVRGYRRPGLVLSEAADRNGEFKLRGGFLVHAADRGISSCPSPLILKAWDFPHFRRWFESFGVDVVVTSQSLVREVAAALERMGLSIPGNCGLLHSNLHETASPISGFSHDNRAIGASAVELLIGKLARNSFGPSPHPRVISQKGCWHDGSTLRPRAR